MQDNRSQKKKEVAFEDKAWMDMRKLLDKEMPVRKKKDRFFFLWWGAAGLVLIFLIIGSLFIFNKKQSDPFYDQHLVEREHSSSTPKKNKKEAMSSTNEIDRTTSTENNTTLPSGQTIVSYTKKQTSLITKSEGTANSSVLENRINSSILIDPYDTSQKSLVDSPKALEEITNSSLGSPPFYEKESLVNIGRKDQLALIILPTLDLMNLSIVSLSPAFPAPPISKKNRIDWSIATTLGTFKLTRLNEYAIGVKTTYQWRNQWRLGMGLNYHYFRLNGLVRANESINTISQQNMDTTTGSAPATSPSEDTNTGNLPTIEIEQVFLDSLALSSNVQYLSIPFFLEYQTFSKIKLDVGAAYYYRLATSYDSQDNRLKTQDWTSFIGIGYQYSSSFNLRFSYERNWSKKRSQLVDTDFITNSSFDEMTTNKKISPLEGRFQLSGIWKF